MELTHVVRGAKEAAKADAGGASAADEAEGSGGEEEACGEGGSLRE